MDLQQRYCRFEPVTIRAAARLVRLHQLKCISRRDLKLFIRELVVIDATARSGAEAQLLRAATRLANLGLNGSPRRLSRSAISRRHLLLDVR